MYYSLLGPKVGLTFTTLNQLESKLKLRVGLADCKRVNQCSCLAYDVCTSVCMFVYKPQFELLMALLSDSIHSLMCMHRVMKLLTVAVDRSPRKTETESGFSPVVIDLMRVLCVAV